MTTSNSTTSQAAIPRTEDLRTRGPKEQKETSGGDSAPARFFRAKGTGLAMLAMNVWGRARHRVRTGPRIFGLDHVTLPCRDLRVAGDFYVKLLGAHVLMRVDQAFLRKMGRAADADAGAVHTSIVFDAGARVDLFLQPSGQAPALAGHPHHAFGVSAGEMMRWKKRLNDAGVPTFGPTRLGPPGQASLYFNDPFGNHLELVTSGFVPSIPVGAPDMASLVYEWKGS